MSILRFSRLDPNAASIMRLVNIWWELHCDVKADDRFFSDYGFLCSVGDKPVLISFFYPAVGTDVCLWGYQVTNPDSTVDERSIAFDETATDVSRFAKSLGYGIVLTYPGNKAIVKRLRDVGFRVGDASTSQAIKEL